ncbi:MAG: hypothetical protein ACTSU5_21145 [Promethearchaeota archaeon]
MREDISAWFNLDVTRLRKVEMERKRKKLVLWYTLREKGEDGKDVVIEKELNKVPDETRLKLFLQKDLYLQFGKDEF